MRLLTWNINSVRLRLPLLLRLLDELRPDVVCLQETKVIDDLFPAAPLAEAGYPHQALHGMKNHHGVAIVSRLPLAEVERPSWCGRQDCRHVRALLPDGLEVHSLYVPSGGDEPDPEANPKFAHKLQFLTEAAEWFAGRQGRPMLLAGDLNVAPLETDVWSHRQLLTVVSHTPVEVEHLDRLQRSCGWVDAVRAFVPPEQRLYTWWSYRARDWSASDRGRRLDHVWATPDLRGRLQSAQVLREARGWERASDHVPVLVEVG